MSTMCENANMAPEQVSSDARVIQHQTKRTKNDGRFDDKSCISHSRRASLVLSCSKSMPFQIGHVLTCVISLPSKLRTRTDRIRHHEILSCK